MRMLLRAEYPNGQFGDPALYVWDINGKNSFLFDCGDLTRFTPRQLLKVSHIFVSHCHIDHFFGFDLFLRLHVGSEKVVTLFGPPDTSSRVAGKLQGYTWNLIMNQSLTFIVVDLDPAAGLKTVLTFEAKNQFKPSNPSTERWDPQSPIYDTGTYSIRAALLDHGTPSLAYAMIEKPAVSIDMKAVRELGLKADSWIAELKSRFLFGLPPAESIRVSAEDGTTREFPAGELAHKVVVPKPRHKIAFATDGAASEGNRQRLARLIEGADLFFAETCFTADDESLAHDTRHFTAEFIGDIAREAKVKEVLPLHFSKRYLNCPAKVLQAVSREFDGKVTRLLSAPRQVTL